ncbi:MAG: histidinol-phosphatase [Clostridium sp.]|nr:histidinol-phosphatase [Clostridium sp.]
MAKIDLIEAIEGTQLYTLHSHTQYCDGRADMGAFVRAASEMHFAVYGFTPHSPVPIESSCNMRKEDVAEYLAEAERLQKDYPDIRILRGMEIDYLGPEWGPANEYFQEMGLDYSIGSVHFIPSQEGEYVDIDGRFESFKGKMEKHFHNDIRYVTETFFSQSQAMLEEGGFDIIGHFDKIKHNAGLYAPGLEETEWYGRLVNDLIDTILDKGVIVEVNTKAWKEHRQLFPDQMHWKRLLRAGCKLVVNSDAHYPRLINAGRMEALHALEYLRRKGNHEEACGDFGKHEGS